MNTIATLFLFIRSIGLSSSSFVGCSTLRSLKGNEKNEFARMNTCYLLVAKSCSNKMMLFFGMRNISLNEYICLHSCVLHLAWVKSSILFVAIFFCI